MHQFIFVFVHNSDLKDLFSEVSKLAPDAFESLESKTKNLKSSNRDLVYGISGIEKLFNISKATAQRYKETFLSPAVSQRGRVIVTDKKLALKLFHEFQKQNKL